MLKKCIERIEYALKEIYFLAQGGTAVGTGINTIQGFDELMCSFLSEETGISFKVCKNKFELLSSQQLNPVNEERRPV